MKSEKQLCIIYDNRLNNVPLEKFTAVEMDIFMGICFLMKNKEDELVEIPFSKIRKVCDYKPTSNKRLEKDLRSVQYKLRGLNYASIKTDEFDGDVYLFSAFGKSLKKDNTWVVGVNKNATYILNRLTEQWTIFELPEYTGLTSRYSKALFRYLKQWSSVGIFKMSLDNFRIALDIPKSFEVCNIDDRVIKPSLKELEPYFLNLSVQKTYDNQGSKGRPSVSGYIFTYKDVNRSQRPAT